MKPITNWRNATVFDVEADGLLDEATKIHVLSYQMQGKPVKSIDPRGTLERLKKFLNHHIHKRIPVVAHNGIGYDIPLLEKILGVDLSQLMVIDTLALSWYLNCDRQQHGLDSFFSDYGIEKPKVESHEWNLSEDATEEEKETHFAKMVNRAQEDVKINKALWEDFKVRLEDMYYKSKTEIDAGTVGGKRVSDVEEIHLDSLKGLSVDEHIERIITFLMFKMDCARLQEKTKWKLDLDLVNSTKEELEQKLEDARQELEGVMPQVPVYAPRKKPAKPFKKNGELSASGQAWEEIKELIRTEAKDGMGHPMVVVQEEGKVKLLKGYNPPNVNSSSQVKDFLFSKGWEPETFKYERDGEAFERWIKSKPKSGSNHSEWKIWKMAKPKDRAIPQVTVAGDGGKELCPSVEKLADKTPEIRVYSNYSLLKHRLGIFEGFLKAQRDGYLKARVGGFTNTLRVQHREIVNLPGVDKPYGDKIRGSLIAGEGKTSLGSDLSSLEDRCKHHFMLPHDPDYVKTMMEPDFDPHILMALSAELIVRQQFDDFKKGIKTDEVVSARRAGKSCNYSSVYNAGPATIARSAGLPESEGQKLYDGYWKLNWAVKAIAEEQVLIKDERGGKWLVNPINGFCYSLRAEKDRFSTLAQGTGSYIFDLWVDNILEMMYKKWGVKSLTGSMHDEVIIVHKDAEGTKKYMTNIVHKALEKVNVDLKLRREMGCDVQFGQSYAEIH